MHIPALTIEAMDSISDDFAALVTGEIRKTLRVVSNSLRTPVSLDDLTRIRTEWSSHAPAVLAGLTAAYWRGVDTVRAPMLAAACTALLADAGDPGEDVGPTVIDEDTGIALDPYDAGYIDLKVPRVDTPVAERYMANASNRLVGISNDVWEVARTQLVLGMAAGEGVRDLAARISKSAGLAGPRAEVIARTEVVGAANAGMLAQAQAYGISEMTKTWLCVAPDTPVIAGEVGAYARRTFIGSLVRIRTASGRCLAVTPQHPVLTPQGWRAAETLDLGDYLFQVVSVKPPVTPDVEDGPPRIGDYVDTLMQTEPVQVWPMPVAVDLDVNAADSDIEVVWATGRLAFDFIPGAAQGVDDLFLARADDLVEAVRLGSGHALDGWARPANTLHGCADARVPVGPGGIGLAGRAQASGDTLATQYHPGFLQDSAYGRLGAAALDGDIPRGVTASISTDEIVGIEVVPFSGHVYDLSTSAGWFLADGLVIHNSTMDDRTRPAHAAANGQTVGIDEQFNVAEENMLRPHDEGAPASAAVNCRCTMTFSVPDESVNRFFDRVKAAGVVAVGVADSGDGEDDGEVTPEEAELLASAAGAATSAMIALVPSAADAERMALKGGETPDELHCTMYFLGDADQYSDQARASIIANLQSLFAGADPIRGNAFGVAHWNPGGDSPSWVLSVGDHEDTPHGLAAARNMCTAAMDAAGTASLMPAQHTPHVAHVCLAYSDDLRTMRKALGSVGPVTFDRVRASFGTDNTDIPLGDVGT